MLGYDRQLRGGHFASTHERIVLGIAYNAEVVRNQIERLRHVANSSRSQASREMRAEHGAR